MLCSTSSLRIALQRRRWMVLDAASLEHLAKQLECCVWCGAADFACASQSTQHQSEGRQRCELCTWRPTMDVFELLVEHFQRSYELMAAPCARLSCSHYFCACGPFFLAPTLLQSLSRNVLALTGTVWVPPSW